MPHLAPWHEIETDLNQNNASPEERAAAERTYKAALYGGSDPSERVDVDGRLTGQDRVALAAAQTGTLDKALDAQRHLQDVEGGGAPPNGFSIERLVQAARSGFKGSSVGTGLGYEPESFQAQPGIAGVAEEVARGAGDLAGSPAAVGGMMVGGPVGLGAGFGAESLIRSWQHGDDWKDAARKALEQAGIGAATAGVGGAVERALPAADLADWSTAGRALRRAVGPVAESSVMGTGNELASSIEEGRKPTVAGAGKQTENALAMMVLGSLLGHVAPGGGRPTEGRVGPSDEVADPEATTAIPGTGAGATDPGPGTAGDTSHPGPEGTGEPAWTTADQTPGRGAGAPAATDEDLPDDEWTMGSAQTPAAGGASVLHDENEVSNVLGMGLMSALNRGFVEPWADKVSGQTGYRVTSAGIAHIMGPGAAVDGGSAQGVGGYPQPVAQPAPSGPSGMDTGNRLPIPSPGGGQQITDAMIAGAPPTPPGPAQGPAVRSMPGPQQPRTLEQAQAERVRDLIGEWRQAHPTDPAPSPEQMADLWSRAGLDAKADAEKEANAWERAGAQGTAQVTPDMLPQQPQGPAVPPPTSEVPPGMAPQAVPTPGVPAAPQNVPPPAPTQEPYRPGGIAGAPPPIAEPEPEEPSPPEEPTPTAPVGANGGTPPGAAPAGPAAAPAAPAVTTRRFRPPSKEEIAQLEGAIAHGIATQNAQVKNSDFKGANQTWRETEKLRARLAQLTGGAPPGESEAAAREPAEPSQRGEPAGTGAQGEVAAGVRPVQEGLERAGGEGERGAPAAPTPEDVDAARREDRARELLAEIQEARRVAQTGTNEAGRPLDSRLVEAARRFHDELMRRAQAEGIPVPPPTEVRAREEPHAPEPREEPPPAAPESAAAPAPVESRGEAEPVAESSPPPEGEGLPRTGSRAGEATARAELAAIRDQLQDIRQERQRVRNGTRRATQLDIARDTLKGREAELRSQLPAPRARKPILSEAPALGGMDEAQLLDQLEPLEKMIHDGRTPKGRLLTMDEFRQAHARAKAITEALGEKLGVPPVDYGNVEEEHYNRLARSRGALQRDVPSKEYPDEDLEQLRKEVLEKAEAYQKAKGRDAEKAARDAFNEAGQRMADVAEQRGYRFHVVPDENVSLEPESGQESKRPVSRAQIVNELADQLGVPVRVGHMQEPGITKAVRGFLKIKPEVIRTRWAHDVRTTAHEIGHFLGKRLGMDDDFLMPYATELVPLATPGPPLQEGLAEYVHKYLTNPKEAIQVAPRFTQAFERRIAEVPGVKDVLTNAREQIKVYKQQGPEMRIESMIDRDPKLASRRTWHDYYSALIDDLHEVQRFSDWVKERGTRLAADKDPYKVFRLGRAWGDLAQHFFEHGPLSWRDRQPISGKSFTEVFAPVSTEVARWERYAIARRVLEKESQGIKTGVDVGDARAVVEKLGSARYERVFNDARDLQNRVLQYLVDSGRVSRRSAERMRQMNQDYIPLNRVIEGLEDLPMRQGLGGRYQSLFSPVRRMKGSGRQFIPPVESMARNVISFVKMAEEQRAIGSLVGAANLTEGSGKFVERIPMPMEPVKVRGDDLAKALGREAGVGTETIESVLEDELGIKLPKDLLVSFRPSMVVPKDAPVVAHYVDGKPQLYQLSAPLFKAVTRLDHSKLELGGQLLRGPATILRSGVTNNPAFWIRNMIRDQFTAWLNNRGIVPGADFLRGFGSAWRQDELYWQAKRAGALHAEMVSIDRDYLQHDKVPALLQEKIDKMPNVVRTPWEFAQWLMEKAQRGSELSEQATRLGMFKKGIERYGDTPEGLAQAAYDAREGTVDFQRAGANMDFLRATVAFWNPGLQGIDRMMRQFRAYPVETLTRAAFGITLPSVALWFANRHDKEIRNLPQWERDLAWPVRVGPHIVRILKPFFEGVLFGSLPERTLDYLEKRDPHILTDWANQFIQAVEPGTGIPVGQSGIPLPVPIPTAFQPLAENYANWSFFANRPIVGRAMQEVAPGYQADPWTTPLLRRLGEATGVSPLKIENAVRGYGGGIGMMTLDGIDYLVSKGMGTRDTRPAPTLEDLPVLGSFLARYPTAQAQPIEDFYRRYGDAQEAQRTFAMLRQTNPEKARAYWEDHANLLSQAGVLQSAAKGLAGYRAYTRWVTETPTLTPEQKRAGLDTVMREMIAAAEAFNERMPK